MSQSVLKDSTTSSKLEADSAWSLWSVGILLAAFLALYVPSYVSLSQTVWNRDDSGHGPLILAMSCWLLWRDRHAIRDAATKPMVVQAFVLLVVGLFLYVLGRSQAVDTVEVASQILVMSACILLVFGFGGLRRAWFPVFFLIFMIPLPGVFLQMLTLPLKSAVSYLAEAILHAAGYPIGRNGVTLTIGSYQLLVADACSGLSSLFTLESLGLFYMNLMNYSSKGRNVILAVMIVPISFASNVIRVMILVLVTYHLGDEAGQGFLHGFAGLVLFSVALTLTYLTDRFLASRFEQPQPVLGGSQ